jgi:hypothetical protein
MTVKIFDPNPAGRTISDAQLARLVAAARHLDTANFGLSDSEIAELAKLARHPDIDWQERAQGVADDDAIALIKLFTVAEGKLSGWQAGAKSPVIPLAAMLKKRHAYPQELTRWIKANTDNRYLPYGNLMDRL